jgi:NAD+ synthase (glutamine-hydrolysing)
MKISIGQINSTVGAFEKNAQIILEQCKSAVTAGSDLIVFPELSLFGYWPADLLERTEAIKKQTRALNKLARQIPKGLAVLVGAVTLNKDKFGKRYHNSAVLLIRGKSTKYFHKEMLPTYDIYDEARYFARGQLEKNVFQWKGQRIHVSICEDMWMSNKSWVGTRNAKDPFLKVKPGSIDLAVNLSASPYVPNKIRTRRKLATQIAKRLRCPFVYVNMVGAQDEVIFDGGSFVVSKKGDLLLQSRFFESALDHIEFDKSRPPKKMKSQDTTSASAQLKSALVLGIKDFCEKNGLKRVHLGLSGGIDSALVACLASEAVGPNNVTLIALPGPFTESKSTTLAKKLSENLGCDFRQFSIVETYESLSKSLSPLLGNIPFGITHENLQSRLRGLSLMAYSNAHNSLLLTTGNKSEYATGHATLYGDMCGGLAPIGDLLKHQVYELSKLYNLNSELIPPEIIERPPTAELRANQRDQDSLPPYDELDAAVADVVVKGETRRTPTHAWLLDQLLKTEFKRWQAAPILRVSEHAFGRGRRFPITNRSAD